MTRDERWKVNLFTAHPRWFIYRWVSPHQTKLQRSTTSCKVLQSSEHKVSNLRNLELAYPIYYQYYSVDRISVIVLLSMQPVWFVDTVYCAGHSCIRNNIVNVHAPTLADYTFFSLSSQHIESTKIHLVESVIIQKKMSRSNAKLNLVNIDDTEACPPNYRSTGYYYTSISSN